MHTEDKKKHEHIINTVAADTRAKQTSAVTEIYWKKHKNSSLKPIISCFNLKKEIYTRFSNSKIQFKFKCPVVSSQKAPHNWIT